MDKCRLTSVDPSKMISISAYAKREKLTTGRVSQKVKNGELKVVIFEGGKAIYEG